MFLKNGINRLCKTLTMRLTLYYVSMFFCVSLLVYVTFYFMLSSMLGNSSTEEIVAEAQEMIILYENEGLEGLAAEFERERESQDSEDVFFAMYSATHEPMLTTHLEPWMPAAFTAEVTTRLSDEQKIVFTKKIPHKKHQVKIIAEKATDNSYVVIGESLEDEYGVRMLYRKIFGGSLCVILFSVGTFGYMLTRKAMKGIRALTQTAVDIERGDLKRRMTLHGKGEEIDGLIVAFNNMIDRIDSLVSELKEVTDNIAHDLRSPITRIRGFVETTMRGEQRVEEYQNMSAVVIEECEILISLINVMLEISEFDAGIVSIKKENVDIGQIARDAFDLFLPVAEEKGIVFTQDIFSQKICVVGDKQKIQRIFSNVLDNALKYTAGVGATVQLRTRCDAEMYRCEISDSGCGISVADQPHIFSRFFRADKSRSTQGNGLGLSLVHSYIKAHGGTISVDSAENKGTTISFSFPIIA